MKRIAMTALALVLGVTLVHAQQQQQKAPSTPATTQQKAPATKKAPAPAPKSLYERLGGEKGISAVVDDMLKNVTADKRIKDFFAKSDGGKVGKLLKEQICQATGGPCKYSGRDMKTAHAGMGVQNKHFNALIEDLRKALAKNKVKLKERNELVALLTPMRKDIVEPPKAPAKAPATTPKAPAPAPKKS